uniref:Ovule protein n=1 Tax=Heterorhabditis bacteriophora TaxID=37862 RepID=A0A1I7WPG6_HETBA
MTSNDEFEMNTLFFFATKYCVKAELCHVFAVINKCKLKSFDQVACDYWFLLGYSLLVLGSDRLIYLPVSCLVQLTGLALIPNMKTTQPVNEPLKRKRYSPIIFLRHKLR